MNMNMNSKKVRVADLACSLAILLFAVWRTWTQWPEPTGWTWAMLGFGVLCVVAWAANPLEKIQTYLLRSMVKTRN